MARCSGPGSPPQLGGHAPRACAISSAGGKWGTFRPRLGSFSHLEALHRWTQLPSGPSGRSGHNTVLAAGGKAYVFGGCGYPAGGGGGDARCLNDLHALDLGTLRWESVQQSAASSASPQVRTCAAMCPSADGDTLFVCGGASDDPDDLRIDLWAFDTRHRTWKALFAGKGAGNTIGSSAEGEATAALDAGSCACGRIGHSICHDPASGRLLVFGGSTGYEYFQDCYAFSLEQGAWRQLPTTGEAPCARYMHRAFVSDGCMYVVGGGAYEPSGGDLELFRLCLASLQWTRVGCQGVKPRDRAAHSLAWDPEGRAAYVWGGFTAGMELSQRFYKLDLGSLSWSEVLDEGAAVPVPSAAAFDSSSVAGIRTYGFSHSAGRRARSLSSGSGGGGGFSGPGNAGHLLAAHHLHPQHERPPARSFHAAVFYKGSHYVLGGSNGAQKFGDVWRYVEAETPPSLAALAAREVAVEMAAGELEDVWLPPEVTEALGSMSMVADKVF